MQNKDFRADFISLYYYDSLSEEAAQTLEERIQNYLFHTPASQLMWDRDTIREIWEMSHGEYKILVGQVLEDAEIAWYQYMDQAQREGYFYPEEPEPSLEEEVFYEEIEHTPYMSYEGLLDYEAWEAYNQMFDTYGCI